MKFILIFILMISSAAFAEKESSTKKTPESVQEIVKEGKSRRKKVEMCHDCGKPEVNCDCPEELRKKEQEAKKNR